MEIITINVKELSRFLDYLADKAESCYKAEVMAAVEAFKREYGIT